MQQRARLIGDRVRDLGMRVAERGDREAGEEVEVLVALAVPELRSLAADERDGQPPVGLHHVLGVERLQLGERTHECDHRSDALPGEEFEQQRVREPAVEDVGPPHTVAQRRHARLELRDHAFGDLAVGDQLLEAVDVDARDQRRLVGPVAVHARDVGEVHELLRVERLGDRARDRVGVDVVGLAVVVDADRRDDRDQLLAQQAHDHRGIDRTHVADEAEPRIALVDADEPGVLARHPDRVRAEPVHHRDDLAVHLADERHAHDVDGLRVGDAPAVDELRLLAEPAHQLGDLRTAAVHDDRVHPDETHEHDVGGEQLGELRRSPSRDRRT